VLKFFEGLMGVSRHGDINVTGSVVPIKLETEVTGTGIVFGDGVASF
jgi:hypothetical protein